MKIILLFLVATFWLPFSSTAQHRLPINLFIGTSGDNGQVDPGAAVPFGMVRVCPDNDPRSHAGYDYAVTQVSGISVNRLSGVGCSGAGGNLRIRPASSKEELHLLKHTEKAVPGYYTTEFNNGVKAELSATHNIALERYTYPSGIERICSIDFASSFESRANSEYQFISDREIQGWLEAKNVCGHGHYKLYFQISSDTPFKILGQHQDLAILSFGQGKEKTVELRISLSPIDIQTACEENRLIAKQSFHKIRHRAATLWDKKLAQIQVKGSLEDRTLFYTSLYRIYLSPANATSHDRRYRATDNHIYTADDFTYYSSWSLWDTFRTKFPLLVLLSPKEMQDMSRSLIELYRTGKKNWSTPYECTPTVRTEHAVILLLDAWRKGITALDFKPGYTGMKKEANELPFKSPDQQMESIYDLWALGQIAEIIGEQEDSQIYTQKAEQEFEKNWIREFKDITPAFEVMGNNGLYQGSRWQYRWAAPQYMDQIAGWIGRDSLAAQVDYFFSHHLYNQGNEPDIHAPYLYNRAGQPAKTQKLVRQILKEEMLHKYGGNAAYPTPYIGRAYKNDPVGYCPEMDEDDGTMSAWYIFSSMGFYPFVVGTDQYELTSPIFDEIRIQPERGKRFTIKVSGRQDEQAPIREIYLNGKRLDHYQLKHAEIVQGGELIFKY